MYTNNENIINIYIYKTKNKSARLRGSRSSSFLIYVSVPLATV